MESELGSLPFIGEILQFFLIFILIFTVVYGILWKTRFLSEKNDINAVVALALALVTVMSGAIPFLIRIIPYYLIVFLILFFILLFGKFTNYNIEAVFKNKYMAYALLGVIITIAVVVGWQEYASSFKASGPTNGTNITGVNLTGNIFTDTVALYNYQCLKGNMYAQNPVNMMCVALHPRVLGALIAMLSMGAATFFIMYYHKNN